VAWASTPRQPTEKIVTNHHVIHGVRSVFRELLRMSRAIDCSGIPADDEDKGLAIVKILATATRRWLLGDSQTFARAGDEVVVIGSPPGLSGTLSVGIIRPPRRRDAGDDDDDESATKRGITK
jgi:S1-C subfamily serine protease